MSVGMMLFLTSLCTAAVIYGWTSKQPPLVFNGLVLGLGFGIIAIGLWKFGGYRAWEYWFGALLLASLAGMVLTGGHDRWYFVYSCGSAAALTLQPWEIWRKRDAGVVDIRLLLLFEASNMFWVVYAYAIRNWVLMVLCPVYVVILLVAIILWLIYRRRSN